jgi:two-component system, OmpR family, sensor kinase
MLDSLGARLLIWHTAIVAAVVAIFGSTVCYLAWRSKLADMDAALASRATTLTAALHPVDRATFDLTLPPALAPEDAPYHALWTRDGALIDQSDDELEIPRPTEEGVQTRQGRRELAVFAPSGAVVLVGQHLDNLRGEIWSLAALLVAAGAVVLVLAVAGGWMLAGPALAPINRISRTAQQMVEGDLSARIPVERVETELGQVARALNNAFDRLQASRDRQRRLTADVSHELRTPLATLSAEVQWAMGRERPADAYRESLAVCRRAAGRMQSIVERLLTLARSETAETATTRDQAVEVPLDTLVGRVVGDLAPLAASRGLTLTSDAPAISVTGDPDRLREALTNVVANAIAYNVRGGQVRVGAKAQDGSVEVSVADTGVGIAAEDLPFIFDAFFRADHARTRDAGGAGLGLTLTRSIVERHGGSIACSSAPGHGTTITIRLPHRRALKNA